MPYDFTVLFKKLAEGDQNRPEPIVISLEPEQKITEDELNEISELRKIVLETNEPEFNFYTSV